MKRPDELKRDPGPQSGAETETAEEQTGNNEGSGEETPAGEEQD